MMLQRGSGILLHISSLPSRFGIGDLGPEAFAFVDFLSEAKQKYWQILPLNPTEMVYGNSPYSSPSAFAGNPLFLDPEALVTAGWLNAQDLASTPTFPSGSTDFAKVSSWKGDILQKAFIRFREAPTGRKKDYERFYKQNAFWLDDYAMFMVIKESFKGRIWNTWPEDFCLHRKKALEKARAEYSEKIEKIMFVQWLFSQQWTILREYARKKGVKLIGDIPIYVNFDSVDVWAHPENYKLDASGNPIFVAGVPPDYFSETGQRWGNPVYDWEHLKKDRFGWWVSRVEHTLNFFDYIRIDHFRGLIGYWEIPAEEETAVNGKWVQGPGDDLFRRLQKRFPDIPIIAEDLGVITEDVTEAMERFGFPGMKVLLFAFGGDLEKHPYIPENYEPRCVVYTGTHDNNTVKGWYENDATDEEKQNLSGYLKKDIDLNALPGDMINMAMRSVAQVALIPLQDVLGLGGEARMNTPATVTGNWEWRFSKDLLKEELAQRLSRITEATGRV